MASITKQLEELINPNPNFDPEDDLNEETRAKLVDKSLLYDEEEDSLPIQSVGKLKKSLALQVDDPKYKGRVVSRKDLAESDATSDEDEILDEVLSNEDVSSDGDSEENVEDDENVEDEEDEEIDSDEVDGEENETEEPGIFKTAKPQVSDREKGKDTLNQISLWESILEARIKLQKLLGLANQLPRPENYDEFLKQGGIDSTNHIEAATLSLSKLGSEMFSLQQKLLKQVDENNEDEIDESGKLNISSNYQHKEWSRSIGNRLSHLTKRRNRILQYWYDKTVLSNNKKKDKSFSSFERPTVAQIDQILADRNRLIKRTRVQRTKYRVLGTVEDNEGEKEHDNHLRESEEVFDDDDFYQQLLRQFIQQKTAQGGSADGSIEMTRNWLKIQHLRKKKTRNVELKSCKGKKIRYVVHPKIVSFMAPADRSTWTHESRNQLIKSLFGKVVNDDDQEESCGE